MSRDYELDVSFEFSPVLWDFMECQTRYSIVLGPVGSGKTVGSIIKPFRWALEQEPGPDNIRPFKTAIVRNTMPELWRTTIETYTSLFTPNVYGDIRRSSPISHKIRWEAEGEKGGILEKERTENGYNLRWNPYDNNEPGLDYHVDFFALDKPKDVKALLSYEASYVYANECREIPKAIMDAAGDRVGRFPSRKKGGVMPTKVGVAGDSNPPDEDHWLYDFYKEPPDGWSFFKQPAGVVEVEQCGEDQFKSISGQPEIGIVPGGMTLLWNGRRYAASPYAENLVNLPIDLAKDPEGRLLGLGNYYLSRIPGKDYSWIQSYYKALFVYVREGKPVIPEFVPSIMAVSDLPILADVPLTGGFDVGGGTLNPAGVIGQLHPRGVYMVHAEVSIADTGIQRFSEHIRGMLDREFADYPVGLFYGDPAGGNRDEIFEIVVFDHLKARGLSVKSAPTNDPQIRIDAIKAPMMRLVDGKPGILINRRRCPKLVKGLTGEWKFRRIQASGAARYADKPEKNAYSHPCDALGYWLCGMGEFKTLRGKPLKAETQGRHNDEYDYFG